MIVVSDTSPIINLAIIGELGLLPILFKKVIIPPAVFHELFAQGATLPGALEIKHADWVEIKECSSPEIIENLLVELDLGEAEAIALAKELAADYILMDENLGRRIAMKFSLLPLGVLGVDR